MEASWFSHTKSWNTGNGLEFTRHFSSAPTLQSSFVTLCHTLTCLLPQTAEILTHGDATCLNSQIHSKYSYSLGTRFMLYIGAVSVTLVFFKMRVVAIDRWPKAVFPSRLLCHSCIIFTFTPPPCTCRRPGVSFSHEAAVMDGNKTSKDRKKQDNIKKKMTFVLIKASIIAVTCVLP